jgi:predicted nucleotidyltransferase
MEKELERILEKARKDKDVLAVILFGSYARKRTLPSSNIDVCLMLKPKRLSSLFISNKKLEYLSMVSSKI